MTAMNHSAKATRMERRHKKAGEASLNLTSLMDIFTILVFFLLVNSSNTQQLPDDPDITLPKSFAEEVPGETLKIMISEKFIIVEGYKVANTPEVLDIEDSEITGLKEELELRAKNSRPTLTEDGFEEREVTIMADRQIPYKLLKKVMVTCAVSDYTKISFAVLRTAQDAADAGEGES